MCEDEEGEVQQADLKKALQIIAFIMNGSVEVGASWDVGSETTTSFNSGNIANFTSEVSSEQDLDTASNSYSETTDTDLESETSENIKSQTCTSLDSGANASLN